MRVGCDGLLRSGSTSKITVTIVTTVTELMKNAGQKVSSAHGFTAKIYGVNPSRLSQEPHTNPLSADSPRHFADGTDESVIVGYYTSAEVYPL